MSHSGLGLVDAPAVDSASLNLLLKLNCDNLLADCSSAGKSANLFCMPLWKKLKTFPSPFVKFGLYAPMV